MFVGELKSFLRAAHIHSHTLHTGVYYYTHTHTYRNLVLYPDPSEFAKNQKTVAYFYRQLRNFQSVLFLNILQFLNHLKYLKKIN